jgi:DNA gyrase subunit A
VRLFNVGDNEHVVGAAKIDESDEDGDEGAVAPDDVVAPEGHDPE